MIETIEDLGKQLRYRKTDETYDEVINRYSEIISDWHTTHTVMLYNLKELIKRWNNRIEHFEALGDSFNQLSSTDVIALLIQCREETKHAMESKEYEHYNTSTSTLIGEKE